MCDRLTCSSHLPAHFPTSPSASQVLDRLDARVAKAGRPVVQHDVPPDAAIFVGLHSHIPPEPDPRLHLTHPRSLHLAATRDSAPNGELGCLLLLLGQVTSRSLFPSLPRSSP